MAYDRASCPKTHSAWRGFLHEWLYERLLKPRLFAMEPEEAHETVTRLLAAAQRLPGGRGFLSWTVGRGAPELSTTAFGLRFPNPLGLAAGFDKDCRLTGILPALGFGFLELGSITLKPQPGNPKPRLFRLPEHEALINRLGFNSAGAQAAAAALKRAPKPPVPLGINLGLNADCPKEEAPRRYAETFELLEPYGDYFAVNVSSPNTTGLRELQERLHLERILTAIQAKNKRGKPLLVKLSPDIGDEQLPGLVDLIRRMASGVIATNTTVSREGLPSDCGGLPGGLSGAPLRARATAMIRKIRALSEARLPIIGVGGVASGGDAFEKIRAGACLVQLYTGLVYRGPGAARRVQHELLELLRRSGFKSVAQAVGSAEPAREAA